jgi:hypothetical protein
MPTNKRQRRREAVTHLSAEAVAAYRLAKEIQAEGLHNAWKEEGGRREEYIAAHNNLDKALHLPPWHCSPLDIQPGAPVVGDGTAYSATIPEALALREALEAAD